MHNYQLKQLLTVISLYLRGARNHKMNLTGSKGSKCFYLEPTTGKRCFILNYGKIFVAGTDNRETKRLIRV